MLLGQAIILGLIQGFTEFLPISSSGHLIIVPELFQWTDHGLAFDAFLHLGTLLAVIIYFRKEVAKILAGFFSGKSSDSIWRRLGFFIIIATIPAALAGLLFRPFIGEALRSVNVVAASLIIWAVVMLIAEEYSRRISRNNDSLEKVTLLQSIAVGFWQIIALIPGTSRSGITLTGGLLAGLNRETAVRFSFILSIPIIAAAGFFSLFELFQAETIFFDWQFALAGLASSAISGYIAIALMLKLVQMWGFKPFAVSRIILALALLFFL